MSNEIDNPELPKLEDNSTDAQRAVQEKLQHIAKKAASRAGNRLQRYDEEHGIFTK